MDFITRMNVGGPARHVTVLSEGMQTRGYRTVLVTGVCEEEQGDLPAAVPAEISLVTLDSLSRSISPLRDLSSIWAAYRLMRRERPTIVHTHTAKAGMVGRIAALAAGVPIVLHTFHGNSLSSYFSRRTSNLFCRIERLLARITDRICVVSDQQLQEISGQFGVAPRAKFRVMPLGLDLSAELALPFPVTCGEVLNVGWLGRLVEIKGIPLLVATIEEAVRRGLPMRFFVGGDGPERPLVEDALARFGPDRVVWAGWRHDVTAFLAQCDVLIQTSRNEGTPVALIQGMAAGRPFVSTAAGGIVDLVQGVPSREERGCRWYSNAILATPDPASFVDALARIRSEPCTFSSMAAAGRQFAAERFDAERLLADMDGLYRELLQKRCVEESLGCLPAKTRLNVRGESG
jgi:glycosyltransferase involved in cell wall biosynthesis